MKYGTAVRCYWYDSAAIHGWQYSPSVGEVGRIVTMGYVVGCKPECVTLSSSISTDKAYVDPLSIPWDAIQKMDKLGTKWDRNQGKTSKKKKVAE